MNKIFIIITLIFSAGIYSNEVNDPFENINRKTFEFNENLDEKILKPTAKFYSKFPPRIKNGDSLLTQLLVWVDLLMLHLKWV